VKRANAWSADYPIEWLPVPREAFALRSYFATGNHRFEDGPESDIVILCDADLCLVDRIDDLVRQMQEGPAESVAGLQAHSSPFALGASRNEAMWRKLFVECGLGSPDLNAAHSLDADGSHGLAPPYFNYGFVAFTRDAFLRLAPLCEDYTVQAARMMDQSFFQEQVGLTLGLAASGTFVHRLSHAFNCANEDRPFRAPRPFRIDSVDEIRAIHYLRTEEVDRHAFLVSRQAFDDFMRSSTLNPVNQRLRQHIVDLARSDDPFFSGIDRPAVR
jgi:hypothetical protein